MRDNHHLSKLLREQNVKCQRKAYMTQLVFFKHPLRIRVGLRSLAKLLHGNASNGL